MTDTAPPLVYAELEDAARALRGCPTIDLAAKMLAGIIGADRDLAIAARKTDEVPAEEIDLWEVWFTCHEDVGSIGYFTDAAAAQRVEAEAEARLIGRWTANGDCIQRVGCTIISINKEHWPALVALEVDPQAHTREEGKTS